MHGCSSGSALLVNAEVDFMGRVVDGGVGIGVKTSPRRSAIEQAQAELRRRELDFLEKGGNPLDFKYGNAASVSVQSTSLTDQHAQHLLPGVPAACEHNSADNLLLFDGENELPEGERKSMHSRTQNVKESEDSTIFRPYARRYRSKIKREGGRSSSTDIVQGRAGRGSSLPARGASKDVKASTSEPNNQKDKNISSVTTTKSATSNGDLASKVITSDDQLNMELDGGKPVEETTGHSKGDQFERKVDVIASKTLIDDLPKEPAIMEAHKSPEQVVSASLERSPGTGATKPENETKNSSVAIGTKGLDMESSSTKNSLSLDVNNDNEACINPKNVDSNVNPLEHTSEKEESPALAVGESAKEKNEIKVLDNAAVICDANNSMNQNHSLNDSTVKVEEVRSELQIEISCPSNNEVIQSNDAESEADRKVSTVQGDNSNSNIEKACASRPQGTMDNFMCEIPEMTFSGITLVDKAREDSILEEARIIEMAKRKRIAELSVGTLPLENSRKSHWDFVLEEMAWLANDFAQERLWKMTAAQICRRVAFTSQFKFEEQCRYWKLKKIALTLANAVMDFWHSAEVLLTSKDANLGLKTCGHDLKGSRANKVTEITTTELDMKCVEATENLASYVDCWLSLIKLCLHLNSNFNGMLAFLSACCTKNNTFAIRAYALRYLKYNSSPVPSLLAEAPATPDRICDLGIMDISWDEHLTEENLFYAVHSGAMETYRRSIESIWYRLRFFFYQKTGSTVQEEFETYDARAEFGYDDSVYDEDEGETSTYYLPGAFEGRQSSKLNHKKRKNPMKSYPARQYKVGADLPYGNCGQPSIFMGKRPASSLYDGLVPGKCVRTGSRQRVLSPFSSAAAARDSQAPTQTDASRLRTQNSLEVDSIGDFERQQPYDCAGTPTKPKRRKKAKNLGLAYNQGWQLESPVHSEQRDYLKKRPESHHFDSNGTSELKIMKHQPDSAYDITPNGSIPSPVGSQMSNMPNPSKIIRLIHGSDKGRKVKTPKMSTGQLASGSPWSLFEDQALVVLVHDMGPNWQLVSDAINSTLQFKCFFFGPLALTLLLPSTCQLSPFGTPQILMDRSGDGADSADDSGSSQPYPSTLPGIPKQEADYWRSQDLKQIVPVHNSHVIALKQVCPNNLNGGVLTPLDLCDATASSQEFLPFGCQASYVSGLAMLNQGDVGSRLPASGGNSSLQGSSSMVLGNNLSSPSAPLNAANVVVMLPAANGVGRMCGVNRSMPMSRPGFQGMASSAMLNSGSMLSSNMGGMPSPVNMPSGPGSGRANSMLRPHDTTHLMRSGPNPEHQMQMAPELQMQAQGMARDSCFHG
ncbi:hypothetical protein ES288_D08G244400v1 [Gossypium darwinii]|uniref:HSA domain-containing protein n=1 Tax=Gossypium darwinii TaxID=34276 RepID=A0A5D2BN09_GOSDA|nr:hypothetical protein ES288_D08G244400v1 [Gossypium darwinii]